MNRVLRSPMLTASAFGILAASMLAGNFVAVSAQDQGAVLRIVADQVRSQGFACENPTAAELVTSDSLPDKPVYLLTCENGNYRVQMIPDQAAKISEVK